MVSHNTELNNLSVIKIIEIKEFSADIYVLDSCYTENILCTLTCKLGDTYVPKICDISPTGKSNYSLLSCLNCLTTLCYILPTIQYF